MKSGLYWVPGVSAAARAAACAKRLDWPDDEGVERVLAHEARRRPGSPSERDLGPPRPADRMRGCRSGPLRGAAPVAASRPAPAPALRESRRPARRPRSAGSRLSRFGQHDDLAGDRAAHHLGDRVGDERAEAGVDPVLGEVGGHPDGVDAVREAETDRRLEPDAEGALVDLLRDEFESLLPDRIAVASLHGRPSTSFPPLRALQRKSAARPYSTASRYASPASVTERCPVGRQTTKPACSKRHEVSIGGRRRHAEFLGDAGRTDRGKLDRQQQSLQLALREIIGRDRGRRERSFRRAGAPGR